MTLLTTDEAADRLRISPYTLRQWVRDGKVKAHKIPSGRILFRVEDLDKLLTGRSRSPSEYGPRLPSRELRPVGDPLVEDEARASIASRARARARAS